MNHIEFRAARQRLGLSLTGMAGALGMSRGQVIRMERAPGSPSYRPVMERTAKLVQFLLANAASGSSSARGS